MKKLRICLWLLFAICLLAGGVLALMRDAEKDFPSWNKLVLGYGILKFAAIVFFVLSALVIMLVAIAPAEKLRGRFRKVLALGIGILVALVVFNVLLMLFPVLQTPFVSPWVLYPNGSANFVEDDETGFRLRPDLRWTVKHDPSRDSDLLVWSLRTAPLSMREECFEDTFVTDSDGFLNRRLPARADIVAVGDSFTCSMNVPNDDMWPNVLSRDLGGSVYNLGLPHFGATQELNVLQRFGIPKKPRLVVWAYFEGNDIPEDARFAEYLAYGRGWVDFQTRLADDKAVYYKLPIVRLLLAIAGARQATFEGRDKFNPVCYAVNGRQRECAIASPYTLRLAMNADEIANHPGFPPTRDAILRAKALCEENGARFVLVYIPCKAHAYWPVIGGAVDAEAFWRYAHQYRVEPQDGEAERLLAKINENIEAQRDLIKSILPEDSFLDLTGSLQEAILSEQQVYYAYDTHFNPAGHELCAREIARFVAEQKIFE